MFEPPELEAEDAVACADALAASNAAERRAVAERFLHVAAWADFHGPGFGLDEAGPGSRHEPARIGGEGTPPVSTAGVVELGLLLETTTCSAQRLLADVLDVRHRLGAHWEAVLDGELEGWKAREVARLTRRLGHEQVRAVDTEVLEAVLALPWGRARAVVEAKVIAADPAAHEARLAEEENRRFVSTRRRSNAAGLRTMVARGAAGDIACLEAMVAHLAGLMAVAGDVDPADTRRAKALAMLANPASTCVFLAAAHDGDAPPHDESGKSSPSAVELAVAFGRTLTQRGPRALDVLRPRSVLYLHVSEEALRGEPGTQVARVDDPVAGGPIGVEQLREWLKNHRVTVKPVLDLTGAEPVDEYSIPTHLREAMTLVTPFESFPYGTLSARQCDGDHSRAYVPMSRGGPPGQTGLHNLGPLDRRHHLAKTFDGFAVHQVAVGLYYWRSPTGHWWRVDHRGTRGLGRLEKPPTAVRAADRFDTSRMGRAEQHLRDQLVRHHAA